MWGSPGAGGGEGDRDGCSQRSGSEWGPRGARAQLTQARSGSPGWGEAEVKGMAWGCWLALQRAPGTQTEHVQLESGSRSGGAEVDF